MNKSRFLTFFGVIFLSLVLVGISLAADAEDIRQPPGSNSSNGTDLPGEAGINSLIGSYVAFESSAAGDIYNTAGGSHKFCFIAESYSPDCEYIYDVWEKTIDGIPGTPQMEITRQTSDTIDAQEVFH